MEDFEEIDNEAMLLALEDIDDVHIPMVLPLLKRSDVIERKRDVKIKEKV